MGVSRMACFTPRGGDSDTASIATSKTSCGNGEGLTWHTIPTRRKLHFGDYLERYHAILYFDGGSIREESRLLSKLASLKAGVSTSTITVKVCPGRPTADTRKGDTTTADSIASLPTPATGWADRFTAPTRTRTVATVMPSTPVIPTAYYIP